VPGGWFFLDEYVGPDRFQFTAEHMRHVNALAELLPEKLRTTAAGAFKQGYRAPSIDEVVAEDPSEAVSSSQILGRLHGSFRVESLRPYGGTILQLLLAEIAQNFETPEAQPYLAALIQAEEELLRQGAIEHHFACVIACAAESITSHSAASNRAGS
jgi:hypothetical protein